MHRRAFVYLFFISAVVLCTELRFDTFFFNLVNPMKPPHKANRKWLNYNFSVETLFGWMDGWMEWVLHQKPGSLRVLHSIFAHPRTVLFWKKILEVMPGICWSQLRSLGSLLLVLPLPWQPLLPPPFSTFFLSPWYLSTFYVFLLIHVAITSYIHYYILFPLLVHHYYPVG